MIASGGNAEKTDSFSGVGFSDAVGKIAPRQCRYALSYDRNNLYFGLVSDLDAPGDSERAELLLATAANPKALRRFAFTPSGGAFALADGEWAPLDLSVANRVDGGKWTLEAAVPFAALGVDSAPDGQEWKFNLGRWFGVPAGFSSAAPVVGRLDDRSHFLTLKFRPDAARIQFAGSVNMKGNYSTLDLSARSSNPASEVKYIGSGDNQKSYGLNTMVKILYANGRSFPVKAPSPPEKRLWLFRDFEVNRQLITEKVGDKEIELFKSKSVSERPFALKVIFLYTQDRKRLSVSAQRGANGGIQVRFLRPDGSLAWRSARDIPTDVGYFNALFDLDFSKLVPGDYVVKVDYVSPDGKVEEVHSQVYRIPRADDPMFRPYVDEEADKVPAPWTPLTSDSDKVEMWGRTYDLSKGFLFSSLVSQGQELLAAPMALRLDGAALCPDGAANIRKTSGDGLLAAWEKNSSLGKLNVRCDIKTHFDGYCEIAMTVAPKNKTLEAKSLSLDIPLRGDIATLVRDNRLSALEGGKSGAVGDYWSQDLFNGRGYYFWVGDEKVGFNWVAPNLAGWHCENVAKSMEIIRQGGVANLRLNLIDSPLKLDAPRTIKFGFTLTPSRPLDPKTLRKREVKDWRMWCQPWKYFAYPDYDLVDRAEIERELVAGGTPGLLKTGRFLGYVHKILHLYFYPEFVYRCFAHGQQALADVRLKPLAGILCGR